MNEPYPHKDNEFIAWYPIAVTEESAKTVWTRRRAGWYVHIPFCTAICDYCGFAVQAKRGANIERYLEALRLEIRRYVDQGRLANYQFVCGHFGGGTPSAIDGAALIGVKKLLDEFLDVSPDAEITVEVNPISFTIDKAALYREHGVNRISFGVQSFQDRILKIVGRPHRVSDIEECLDVIRRVGFDNYSLDIIYGVPGQTLRELRDDLERAAETGAVHISAFRLAIIPFTVLKLRESAHLLPPHLSIGCLNDMDDLVTDVLTGLGYREYGVFNFVRPGYESVHNEIAFVAPQGEYVGFGNGAWSYINDHVYCNHADVDAYVTEVLEGRDPIALARRADSLEQMSRYFILGVKFFRVPRRGFRERFGMDPEQMFGDVLSRLTAQGLLSLENDDYLLTRRGRHYVNNVCKEFFTGENRGQSQHPQFVPNITVEQINHYARLRNEADKTAATQP